MRAIIVSGGNPPSKELLLKYVKKEDLIIGVDKGCNALYEYNIEPNIILGDFDSVNEKVLDYFKTSGSKVTILNPEKDYTDTDIGYMTAKENGADEILFFGVTGSRMDHMLGNLGILLKALNENVKAKIIDDNNVMYLVNGKATFKGEEGSLISFHALSHVVKNLKIEGAKYELENYDLTLLEPRAISNVFLDKDITISFDSGIILVIFPRD